MSSLARILFVGLILLVGSKVTTQADESRTRRVDALLARIAALEAKIKQLEAGCSCGCECSRAATKPAPIGPRRVWIPPRQTRDEDDYTPGRWEVVP